jgi:hypothetical protein
MVPKPSKEGSGEIGAKFPEDVSEIISEAVGTRRRRRKRGK